MRRILILAMWRYMTMQNELVLPIRNVRVIAGPSEVIIKKTGE